MIHITLQDPRSIGSVNIFPLDPRYKIYFGNGSLKIQNPKDIKTEMTCQIPKSQYFIANAGFEGKKAWSPLLYLCKVSWEKMSEE